MDDADGGRRSDDGATADGDRDGGADGPSHGGRGGNEQGGGGEPATPDHRGVDTGEGGLASTVVGVFWNRRERRLRAPWRLFAGLLVGGVVVFLLVAVASMFVDDGGLLVVQSLTMAAILLSVPVVAYLVDRRRIADYGLGVDRQWWRDTAFGLALGVVMPTALFLVQFALGWVTVTGTFVTDAGAFLSFGGVSAGVALLLALAFFVGVGVYEEVFVRGYLLTNVAEGAAGLPGFDERRGVVLATLATAAVFGLLHAMNPSSSALSITNITFFGILLGLGFVWTDRLGVPIGLHIAWNTVVGAVYGFPVSGITVGVTVLDTETTGPALLTGGSFGPEGGLIALLALVVGLALSAWWVRREYGAVALRESVAVPTLRTDGVPAASASEGTRNHGDDGE